MKATIQSTDQLVDDNSEFERELSEHKQPEPATQRAIDMRFFLD